MFAFVSLIMFDVCISKKFGAICCSLSWNVIGITVAI